MIYVTLESQTLTSASPVVIKTQPQWKRMNTSAKDTARWPKALRLAQPAALLSVGLRVSWLAWARWPFQALARLLPPDRLPPRSDRLPWARVSARQPVACLARWSVPAFPKKMLIFMPKVFAGAVRW